MDFSSSNHEAALSPLVMACNGSSSPQSPLVSNNGSPATNHNSVNSSNGGSSSKPRTVVDWTDEEAEILMVEYENHRCLWDPIHPNYHSNNERTYAYAKILEKLGDKFNITDIKKKINSIRTQFNQERNRLMKMAAESGGTLSGRIEDTRFKYYDRLSFLAESVDLRRNQRSITPKVDSGEEGAQSSTTQSSSTATSSADHGNVNSSSNHSSSTVMTTSSYNDNSNHGLNSRHQTAAIALANLGNALSSYSNNHNNQVSNSRSHQSHSSKSNVYGGSNNRGSSNDISDSFDMPSASSFVPPPLIPADILSKYSSACNGSSASVPLSSAIPLSISTSNQSYDENSNSSGLNIGSSKCSDLRTPNGIGTSSLSLSQIAAIRHSISNSLDLTSSCSTSAVETPLYQSQQQPSPLLPRVPGLVYQGSPHHIPISPVSVVPPSMPTVCSVTTSSTSTLPTSNAHPNSLSPKIKQETVSCSASNSELLSPTKQVASKPTCAIIPESNKSRSVVAPQPNNSSNQSNVSSSSLSNQNSLRSMVPPRKRQKFANLHEMHVPPSPNTSQTLHIPKNSTVNLQVNEAIGRTKAEESRQNGTDDSFGSYIAAEMRSIQNQSIKNKLKLQIISLIIQSSNDEILGFNYD